MQTGPPLTLTQVLELLGHTPDEHVQLCQQSADQPFASTVYTVAQVEQIEADGLLPQDRNIWFSPNPTEGPPRSNAGRGGAAQVTRLAALWADLDIKTGGCPNLTTAQHIIDDLAAATGTPPTAITASGHGLQPLWAVEDAPIGEQLSTAAAAALLRRWGRLVTAIADRRHAQVDAVWDLPRILRAPATVNWKHPTQPVPVITTPAGGAPITVERLLEVLDEYAIPQLVTDGTDPGVIISPPAEWEHADNVTCAYARRVITGWQTDQPAARHPWLVAQAVRLAAMHRNQCITADDYTAAERTLIDRFTQLVSAAGDRGVTPGEIRDALSWATLTAATFSNQHLAAELGAHQHTSAPPDEPPVANARLETGGKTGTTVIGANVLQFPIAKTDRITAVNLTDQGNADLLAERHHQHLRYTPARATWLTWAGHRWVESTDDGEAIQAAVDTIRAIRTTEQAERKHVHSSLSRRALEAAARLAARHPAMRVDADQLDNQPHHLNTPQGVVDLATGDIAPNMPEQLHTRATGVHCDPTMPSPLWNRFLEDTFQGRPNLAEYVQRLAGYSTLGKVTHHVLPFLHGAGGNGKTVLLDVLQGVLGTYASSTPLGFLLAGGRDDESAIARLHGLRLIVASEVGSNAKFDEAKVKQLTGGDRITARHLYARHFTFRPTHTIWLAGNHQPRVDAGGESFWRRLRLIPFEHTVPKEERIGGLADRIIADEGPAVLAWAVQGAITVLATHTLNEPPEVTAATEQYAEEEDALARFVADCCQLGGGEAVRINQSKVRAAYEQWCKEEGEKPVTPQTFGRELRTRWSVLSKAYHGQRFYLSMSLIASSELPWDPQ